MSEYYKSLVSDGEVINALIKDSKRREGKLPVESSRIKPNLNFFQRTVTNLVSVNTRIDTRTESVKTKLSEDYKDYKKIAKTGRIEDCKNHKQRDKRAYVSNKIKPKPVFIPHIHFVKARNELKCVESKPKIKNFNINKVAFVKSDEVVNSKLIIGGTSEKVDKVVIGTSENKPKIKNFNINKVAFVKSDEVVNSELIIGGTSEKVDKVVITGTSEKVTECRLKNSKSQSGFYGNQIGFVKSSKPYTCNNLGTTLAGNIKEDVEDTANNKTEQKVNRKRSCTDAIGVIVISSEEESSDKLKIKRKKTKHKSKGKDKAKHKKKKHKTSKKKMKQNDGNNLQLKTQNLN